MGCMELRLAEWHGRKLSHELQVWLRKLLGERKRGRAGYSKVPQILK